MTQAEIQLFEPRTLYRRWEDSQWNPFEIDLERDKAQWNELAEQDQDLIYWVLAQLMVAEERITTKFSGLVGAYGSEEEATFLATQQVDEARQEDGRYGAINSRREAAAGRDRAPSFRQVGSTAQMRGDFLATQQVDGPAMQFYARCPG